MTSLSRGACASLSLGLGMALMGCGGGGSGISTPTATPKPGVTPTPTPTPIPNGSGPITANQVVFVSSRSGANEIYKADLNGSNPVQLTHLASQGFLNIDGPTVSPDGRRIAFQYGTRRGTSGAGATANLEIAQINVDGTHPIALTSDTTAGGRPDDYSPVYSADGKTIFWTSERLATTPSGQSIDQRPHIWREDGFVGGEAGNQKQFILEQSFSPSVNRAGNTLAYIALEQTSFPITLQPLSNNALTGSARRIGGNIAGNAAFNLALSPDGNRVAFSSVMTGTVSGDNGMTSSATSQVNILDIASNAIVAKISAGTSNAGSAWSRDSNTFYFDAAGGTGTNRQIFSLASPFTGAPKQITTDAQGTNFSPSFLSGG